MATPLVYAAIEAIMMQIGKSGISKDQKNVSQGYKFRGIDDVLNALNPLLAEHKLCILPCALERQCEERSTKSGSVLFYVTVKVRYDFVSAIDGSKHEIFMYGEAMDSADKATNKAMSSAYKYAAIQAFCIPTEGDNDADFVTHDVAPKLPAHDGLSDIEMDNVDFAMEECDNFDSLKKVFGPAFQKASDSQQKTLKAHYEKIKTKNKWGVA